MDSERLTKLSKRIGTWIERLLASGIVAGILVYGTASAMELVSMNWHDTATFYELIYRVLLMAIGIELVRTLLTHSLEAILELLAFVVARKTFKADVEAVDIFLCALAFVALLWARHSFLRQGDGVPFRNSISK